MSLLLYTSLVFLGLSWPSPSIWLRAPHLSLLDAGSRLQSILIARWPHLKILNGLCGHLIGSCLQVWGLGVSVWGRDSSSHHLTPQETPRVQRAEHSMSSPSVASSSYAWTPALRVLEAESGPGIRTRWMRTSCPHIVRDLLVLKPPRASVGSSGHKEAGPSPPSPEAGESLSLPLQASHQDASIYCCSTQAERNCKRN